MDPVKNCNNCKRAPASGGSIENIPDICWVCLSKDTRVYWIANVETEEEQMGSGADNMDQYDEIDKPIHYNTTAIQPIDVIEAWDLEFHLANVVKYINRAPFKGNPMKDYKKAQWYLNRFISLKEREQ